MDMGRVSAASNVSADGRAEQIEPWSDSSTSTGTLGIGKRLVLRGGGGGPAGDVVVFEACNKALRSGEIARGPVYADVSVSERWCPDFSLGDNGTSASLSKSDGWIAYGFGSDWRSDTSAAGGSVICGCNMESVGDSPSDTGDRCL
jgi:hypothetical protein